MREAINTAPIAELKKCKEGEKIAKKSLSKREKLFCLNYVILPDGRDAAIKAGYTVSPQTAATKLLSRKDISDEISSLAKVQMPHRNEAAAGYRRLAFGNVSDALRLIFCEDPPTREQLEEMDLIRCERDSNRVYYSLNRETVEYVVRNLNKLFLDD